MNFTPQNTITSASVAAALRAERAALHAAGESTERDWSERVRVLLSELAPQ